MHIKAFKVFVRADESNCAYIGGETAGTAKYRALKTTHGRSITELGALLERVPGSVPGGEQACEVLVQAIVTAKGE